MFIARLITIAAKPKITIISFIKGSAIATSLPEPFTGFFASSHEKKTNNKKATLQMNVTLEKKDAAFMLA
jgi:hypothetical protein